MKIGIGLPNPVPGTPGTLLLDWSRQAEARGFSGLATIDRVVYPTHDSFTVLAAAAGATSRIELLTNVLVAPAYPAALVAKAGATLHGLSGGRFTLGIGVGGRPDDFAATGQPFNRRGHSLDAALELWHDSWRGRRVDGFEHPFTSAIDGGVPLLIGGASDAAIERVVRWGVGWTSGGAPPADAAKVLARVVEAWRAGGRQEPPRLAALAYFALGDDAVDAGLAYLRGYYGFAPPYAELTASRALRTPQAVRDAISAFEDAGFTELYLDPTTAQLDQVDRLADIVL